MRELPVDAWRRLALQFHAIRELAVWNLDEEFDPYDLAELMEQRPTTGA